MAGTGWPYVVEATVTDWSGPRPIEPVSDLEAYSTPRPRGPIDLDLSGNVGPIPPPAVLEALADLDGSTLRDYPDLTELRDAIATRHDVSTDRVIVTAGGDQAIDLITRAFLEPGRHLCTHTPSFVMIERAARLAGAEVTAVPWPAGTFPVEPFLEAAETDPDLAFIVSPNNPTGTTLDPAQLEHLATALAPALVVIDHAYVEFAEADLTEAALRHENVAVIRTLSKAFGLAGARVGYLLGHPQLIEYLSRIRSPYPLSAPSIAAAMARLEARDDVGDHVAAVQRNRRVLEAHLSALGIETTTSQANFVFGTFPDGRWAFDGLAGLGIRTRMFPGRHGLEDALRISVPAADADRTRLEDALGAVLDPAAILLDMDGVFADVQESYREAIIRTADDFDVAIDREDIERAKQAGDANDDWELTQSMLEDAGVEVSFEEVKATFEAHYLGEGDREPLFEREALVGGDSIGALAEKRPLGIVTGRPRRDARRFLQAHGIGDRFDTIVCKEDAESKPHPAPVEQALDALAVDRAWLVGDTPDDIRAARRAGVLPIGITPPETDRSLIEGPLLEAGAARVVDTLAAIDHLLTTATTTR